MAVRLTDLMAGLSRLADLGFGLSDGESLRSAALTLSLGRSLGLSGDELRAGMSTALLLHVGCVGYAHETARSFGDEFLMTTAAERADRADPREIVTTLLPRLLRGRPVSEQAQLALTSLVQGKGFGRAFDTASCEVGRHAAGRLGLSAVVQRSIYHAYEWWNGGGVPDRLAGDDIPIGSRLAALTSVSVMFDRLGGVELAVDAVRQRSGGILDPDLAGHFADRASTLLGELGEGDPMQLVLDGEPRPRMTMPEAELMEAAAVFGDLADVKTPYTHGHSRGVAILAREAGGHLGLPQADCDDLELAGLLHDVGRVGISSTVWEQPGGLDAHQWEQVRLHAYYSERILAGSERLAPLARVVGMHHERGDGNGYHREVAADEIPMPARILAAADVYQAMTQRRPHRPALTSEQAERQLLDEARAGRLDTEAVGGLLAAAGHDVREVRREPPAGLTEREVEVLRLLAAGCSNRQIAQELVVSRRTAEFHVQQIYRKIGTSSRAAAAMFAMEHRLLGSEDW